MNDQPLDLSPLQEILGQYKTQRGAVIPVLQKAQEIYGWLPPQVLQAVARGMNVPLSQVYGVVTFYSQFYLSPRGRHVCRQCDGTACHVRGSGQIIDAVERHYGIQAGGTTADGRVTFEVVYCLGSCGLAPIAVVDDRVVGPLTPDSMIEILDRLE